MTAIPDILSRYSQTVDPNALVETIGDNYPDVSKSIVRSLIQRESSGNPFATADTKTRHGAARGLGQFIDATAEQYIPDWKGPEDSYVPEKNVEGIFRYLSDLQKETGSTREALKRYLGTGEADVFGTRPDDYADQILEKAGEHGTPKPKISNKINDIFSRYTIEEPDVAAPQPEPIAPEVPATPVPEEVAGVPAGLEAAARQAVQDTTVPEQVKEEQRQIEKQEQLQQLQKMQEQQKAFEQSPEEQNRRLEGAIQNIGGEGAIQVPGTKAKTVRAGGEFLHTPAKGPQSRPPLPQNMATATALGALESIPFVTISGVDAKTLRDEFSGSYLAGQITGNVAQGFAGGTVVKGGLQAIKSPMLRNMATRAIVSGGLSGAQGAEEVLKGEKSFKDAFWDTVQAAGAGAISVIPEMQGGFSVGGLKIPWQVVQVIGQPMADLAYDAAIDSLRGKDVNSKDWWKKEAVQLGISTGFALQDVASGEQFVLDQKLMKKDAKQVFAKMAQWAKGKDVKVTGADGAVLPKPAPVDKAKGPTVETQKKIEELDTAIGEFDAATREPIRGDQKAFNETAKKIGAENQEDLEALIDDPAKFEEATKVLNDKEFAEFEDMFGAGMKVRDIQEKTPAKQAPVKMEKQKVKEPKKTLKVPSAKKIAIPDNLLDPTKDLKNDIATEADPQKKGRLEKAARRMEDNILPGVFKHEDAWDVARYCEDNEIACSIVRGDGRELKAWNSKNQNVHAQTDKEIKQIWGDIYQKKIAEAGGIITREQGDEFVIALPGYTKKEASALMEKIEQEAMVKAEEMGLDKLPSAKNEYNGLPMGTGVIDWGVAETAKGKHGEVDRMADEELAARKIKIAIDKAIENDYNIIKDPKTGNVLSYEPKKTKKAAKLATKPDTGPAKAIPKQKPRSKTTSTRGLGKTRKAQPPEQKLTKKLPAESPDLPESELPTRKRGFSSEVGGTGEKSFELKPQAPQSRAALQTQAKLDRQDKAVRAKLKTPFKEQLRKTIDSVGAGIVDVNYYAKRVLKGTPGGEQVNAKLITMRGSSAEAKAQYEEVESAVSEHLPHRLEKGFNRFLQLQRIIEVEKLKGPDIKSTEGLNTKEAQAYLDELKNQLPPKDYAALKHSAKKYHKGLNNQLKQLRDEGLITESLYDKLSTEQSHYNPRLFIQHIDPDRAGVDKGGRKISVSESGIKKLDKGSEGAMVNNFRYLLADVTGRTQTRIFKNRASKALYNFVKKSPTNSIGARIGNPKTELKRGESRIDTFIGGEARSVIVPEAFADSFVASDPAMSKGLANTLRILSGSAVVRPLATGVLAPEFALSNIPRDAALSWIASKEYSTAAPVALFQMGRNYAKVFKDAWTGKGAYRDYVREGGGMDFLNEQGRILSKDPTQPLTPTDERARQIWGAMNKLQEFSERLGRLAVREQALRRGKTPEQATLAAREVLDFSQGGSWTKALDNAVPYLNAATQGTRSVIGAFKKDPKVAAAKATQLILMGAGTAMLANTLSKDAQEKISDREKVSRWNFPLPMSYEDRRGETRRVYFSIPKDQGQRVFATIGEVMAERAQGVIDGERAWNKIKMAFSDVSPVDVVGVIPPTLSAAIGYSLNKDFWTREDIWKGREVSPSKEFYSGHTSAALVDMTALLSKMGVEVSPARLESASRQVIPMNPVSALMGMGYEQLRSSLSNEVKQKLDRDVVEHLVRTPGVRKYLRQTWPSGIDSDKLTKEVLKYNIEEYDRNGILKSKIRLNNEVKKAKIIENNQKQKNDNRLNAISKLMLAGADAEFSGYNDLLREVTKGMGPKEARRLINRMKAIRAKNKEQKK